MVPLMDGRQHEPTAERPSVLLLTATGYYPPFIEETQERALAGEVPRVWLYDLPYDITFLDQRFLTGPPRWLRRVYDRLPMPIAQAIEAFRVQDDYDCIFAWGAESVSLPFALMLRLARKNPPLVGIFGWVSPPKKAWLIRAAWPKITTFIIPTIVQTEYAVQHLKVPADKVVFFHWPVDVDFWQALDGVEQEDMICSAGREMRDFSTLIEALDGTGIRCHIAGSLVRGKIDNWRKTLGDSGEKVTLPENITFGPRSPREMRELYTRSRFVVLPLNHSDTDNGVTCMMEAFSMGRPAICSQVEGQRDVLDDGRNGLYVPVGDAAALRKAIMELFQDRDRAAAMGKQGRHDAEERFSVDRWIREITQVIDEALAKGSSRQGRGTRERARRGGAQ